MADTKKGDPVQDANAKALEADKAAAEAKMTPEERKAAEAHAKADEVLAKANEDEAQAAAVPDAMSVAEARMLVPADKPEEMAAGDHMAQRFGNYPANPAPASAEHSDPEKQTVSLYMIVPDHEAGRRTTKVHPDMVGDYLRAGWSVD